MTDEEINKAIAEIVGIQFVEEPCGLWSAMWPNGKVIGFKIGLSLDHVKRVATPNFCADLNAVAEAEKHLSEDQLETMNTRIWEATMNQKCIWQATARQRAMALIEAVYPS